MFVVLLQHAADADHRRPSRLIAQRMADGHAPHARLDRVGLPKATKGRLPGSVIFISPASAAANMPRVVPLAVLPSAKMKITGWPGLADHVAGRHHNAVLADNHAAAGGLADPDADHRRHDLGHHRLDLRFHRLESGQVLGRTRSAAWPCAAAVDCAKVAAGTQPQGQDDEHKEEIRGSSLASFIAAPCPVE